MPTVRLRHQITETPAIAHAIDIAAHRWPGETRSNLVRRLLEVGAEALEQSGHQGVNSRREAVMASSGKYTDAFGQNYLSGLREDWPA